MTPPPNFFSVKGYFLRVVAWLPLFFVLWYFLAGVFSIVPMLASQWIINLIQHNLVLELESIGRHAEYVTSLTVPMADQAKTGNVIITLNPLIYSWNIPVLLALCYAVQDELFSNKRIIFAVLGLLPFHTWGLVAEFFVTVLFRQGDVVAQQLGFVAWQRELVALTYQFGYLMLPVISAISIWFLTNRDLVKQLIHETNLPIEPR